MTQWLIRRFVKDYNNVEMPAVRKAYGDMASFVGICLNVLLAAVKLLSGLVIKSVAMVADGVNNLSDAGGAVMSLVTMRMAQKPRDKDHPLGHGRMEYIGALGVGIIILIMGWELLRSGISGILNPVPPTFSWLVLALAAGGVAVKAWLVVFYRKVGGAIASPALLATGKDALSDVFAGTATVLSLLLAHFFALPADGYVGTLVALLVLKAGFDVCKDTLGRLIGGTQDPALREEITRRLLSYDGILGIHDLVVHDYGPGRGFASVHAEVPAEDDLLEIHQRIDRAEREIGEEMHMPICIHMDPVVRGDRKGDRAKRKILSYLQGIDKGLHVHDFRREAQEGRDVLYFDITVPPGFEDTKELEKQLRTYLETLEGGYDAVLRFDLDLDEPGGASK